VQAYGQIDPEVYAKDSRRETVARGRYGKCRSEISTETNELDANRHVLQELGG
jgi:hypothetical protein